MQAFNIRAAKTHPSRPVERAAAGEEIVIARAGRPMAKLIAFEPHPSQPRTLGCLAGVVRVPDDFDAALPEALLDVFEGR